LTTTNGGGGLFKTKSASKVKCGGVAAAVVIALAVLAAQNSNASGQATLEHQSTASATTTTLTASSRMLQPRPNVHAASPVAQPLLSHSGVVQKAPRLYVVFWGWTSDPSGERPYLLTFLNSVRGSPWLQTVAQYGAGDAPVLGGTWSDPSSPTGNPSDAQIQAEAVAAAAHFGLGSSVNDQIIVATPTGHSSPGFGSQWCGYHGVVAARSNLSYTNLPYVTDAGLQCGAFSVKGLLDGVSIVAGHELAEAITDPLLDAWYDAGSDEIADKCAWQGLASVSLAGRTFAVQPLWSNLANRCVLNPAGWKQILGAANRIATGADGSTWILGTGSGPDYPIYRWNGSGWTVYPGAAVRIAVGPDGTPWVVNAAHHIYHWNGTGWTVLPGAANDIAVGADSTVSVVGIGPGPNHGIYRWSGNGWTVYPGAAVRIAVGPDGTPWVVNAAHHIYHWTGKAWTLLPGAANEIAVGVSGLVWVIGAGPGPNYGIYYWYNNTWGQDVGGAVAAAADWNSSPWVVSASHHIYYG
jgi:Tectonin domain